MQKNHFFTYLSILITFILAFFLISCDNLGIFAVIAVTDKIDLGVLPEGISARPVVQVDSITSDYAFFASGPGLWAKNISKDSIWYKVPLTSSDGTQWEGVQAMAASDQYIFLALYKADSDNNNTNNINYTVALHRMDSFDGRTAVLTPLTGDSSWSSTDNHYQQIRLFCPNGSGNVYVNVMENDGKYGSLDETGQKFKGSHLYVIPNDATSLNIPDDGSTINQDELDGTNGSRYVTGIADNMAGTIRITATDNMFASEPVNDVDAGILLDESGNIIPLGSNISTTGITWLPNIGAFIASATGLDLDENTFPMFASKDGNTWTKITRGTTTDYLSINFIDVSATLAGSSNGARLILVGTSSYIDSSKQGREASGYQEIDARAGPDHIDEWTINTTAETFEFALNNNYAASDLGRGTITGMSFIGTDLYASTRGQGVWKIDTTQAYPEWDRE